VRGILVISSHLNYKGLISPISSHSPHPLRQKPERKKRERERERERERKKERKRSSGADSGNFRQQKWYQSLPYLMGFLLSIILHRFIGGFLRLKSGHYSQIGVYCFLNC
jgi:hypothetical protein